MKHMSYIFNQDLMSSAKLQEPLKLRKVIIVKWFIDLI